MSYLIGIVLALLVAALFVPRSRMKRAAPPTAASPVSRSRKPKETERTPAFAERHVNGRYRPMTAEQVDALLAPFKEETQAWKAFARKLWAHEKRATASGKLNEKLIAEARALLPAVQARALEFAALVDDLFFARESSSKGPLKDVDALKAVGAELSEALVRLDDLKGAIVSGKFVPSVAPASERAPNVAPQPPELGRAQRG